jgi:hypothetical protein
MTRPDNNNHLPMVEPEILFDGDTGSYTIAPLFVDLNGLWRFQFDLDASSDAGTSLDGASFYFCIES